MLNRVFFIPFSKDRTNYISSSFEQSRCEYRIPPSMETKNEKIFKKKSILRKIRDMYSDAFFATKILKECSEDDVIVIWIFRYAVTIGLFSRLLNKKAKIVAMNFIDHTSGWKVKVKSVLYNYIFRNPNFHLSVNCIEYVDTYCEKYKGLNKSRIFEMQDSYYFDMPTQMFSEGKGYIFCGGNIRDWKTYFEAAELLPDYKFVAAASSSGLSDNLLSSKPENMEVHLDIPGEKFVELLANCSVSVIAVPSDVPNGFTVIFQSAFLNRPIVATETMPINKLLFNTVTNTCGGVTYELCNSIDLANKIDMLYKDTNLREKVCKNMLRNAELHSPKAFSESLKAYIEKITE